MGVVKGFGWAANLILFVAVIYGVASNGPSSFSSGYQRQVERTLRSASADRLRIGEVVTEVDLGALPEPVATYLRRCGAVGQPHVWNFGQRYTGESEPG